MEDTFVETDDEDEERFKEQEVPFIELEKDLEKNDLIEKVNDLQKQLTNEKLIKEQLVNKIKANDATISDEEHKISNKDVKDETLEKRVERRRKRKEKKSQLKEILPNLGQRISFREYDSDIWQHAIVSGVFKKNSVRKNF